MSADRLTRPPRDVPPSLRLALRFGGVGGIIGWLFVAMSLTFVVIFAAVGDFGRKLALQTATLARTEGFALGWEPTHTQVDNQRLLANGAAFFIDGRRYECRSYQVGVGLGEGERVVIEYDRADPTLCQIVGMDVSGLPWWIFLPVAPFLLIGGVFAGWRLRYGGRLIRLLRDGKVAWGTCVAKTPTHVRINDQMQWMYTFRFEDELGRAHDVIGRTTDTRALEDAPREAILYDPYQPDRAMIIDTEARLMRIDRHGGWIAPGLGVLPRLIAPAISLALGIVAVMVF